jgi:uncharacterized protein
MMKKIKKDKQHLIGVISDTHGLIRPEAFGALKGSDLIIHAGDIGHPQVLENLRTIAPVVAVRGNTDRGEWVQDLHWSETIEMDRNLIHVLHDINGLDLDPIGVGLGAVIFGHSHQPAIRVQKGVLFLNPGSAGPRRFNLPVSVALLHSTEGKLEPQLIELKVGTRAVRKLF